MTVANLKNIFGGGGGSGLVLKAGQSFNSQFGVGGVSTTAINVSSPTDVISLTGRWAVTFIQITCSNPSVGTMTATLNVDGVNVLSSSSIGTAAWIPVTGMVLNSTITSLGSAQSPVLVCNSGLTLTLQRSTSDTVTIQYCALAIE